MKRKMHKIYIIFVLLGFFSMPVFIVAEWLSDKITSTLRKNSRGYFIPELDASKFPKISLIQARYLPSERSVQIGWKDSRQFSYNSIIHSSSSLRYIIYRSTSTISSEAALNKAAKIGVVTAGKRNFTDKITTKNTYYYAISVLDRHNIEYFRPRYDQSYLADGIKVDSFPDIVQNIRAVFKKEEKKIILSWTPAAGKGLVYRIYRSKSPIFNSSDKKNSTQVGKTDAGAVFFSYTPTESGNLYFAIVSVDTEGRESIVLTRAKNTLGQPLNIKVEQKISVAPLVTSLKAIYSINTKRLNISWKFRNDERPSLQIFRNTGSPINQNNLTSSTLIKTMPYGSTNESFSITNPSQGQYYFAVISINRNGVKNQTIEPATNSLTNMLIVASEKIVRNITNFNTNTIVVYQTNFITNTNFVSLTNTVIRYTTNTTYTGLTNIVTNQVFITNQVFNTNHMTNYVTNNITNFVTNQEFVTNTIMQTNYYTNTVFLTNQINATNINIVTNHLYITNTVQLTNVRTLTNYRTLTNATIVTNIIRKRLPDDRYRPVKESDTIQLRRTIRRYFRNAAAGNRHGLTTNIMDLKRIQLQSRDTRIRNQCTLFIGQAYFKLGRYRNAYKEFVKLRDAMPDESDFWIRRCVNNMR